MITKHIIISTIMLFSIILLVIGCANKIPLQESIKGEYISDSEDVKHQSINISGLIAYPGEDEKGNQQIFTINLDGTGKKQLTFDGSNGMPSWSPDGNQIVYSHIVGFKQGISPGTLSVWIMDTEGNRRKLVDNAQAAEWGPNNKIVYLSKTNKNSPSNELYIIDSDGQNKQQITFPNPNIKDRTHPTWSSDGKEIAFTQFEVQDPENDDSSNGCKALPMQNDIWIINVDTKQLRKLTVEDTFYNKKENGDIINSAFDANAPDWSPVNNEIVFWSGQEFCYGNVWKINKDGSGRTQLTEQPIPSRNDDPTWSPDGKFILFSSNRDGKNSLYVMNADGSNERKFIEHKAGPFPADAAWRPPVTG